MGQAAGSRLAAPRSGSKRSAPRRGERSRRRIVAHERPSKRAKPAVAGPVHRRVGRHPWTTSRPVVLHERGNLHELDARAHTVETGYPLD